MDIITACQLSQGYTQKRKENILGVYDFWDNDLKKVVERLSVDPKALVLGYDANKLGEQKSIIHAIVAYGCTKDKINDEYLISIFDVNNQANTVLHVSIDCEKFYFVDGKGNKIGNIDGYAKAKLEFLDTDYLADYINDSSAEKPIYLNDKVNLMIKTRKGFDTELTINNPNTNSKLCFKDGAISGNMDYSEYIIAQNNEEQNNQSVVKLYSIDKDALYIVKYISGEADILFYDDSNTFILGLGGENIKTANVSVENNSIQLSGEMMNYATCIMPDNTVEKKGETLITVSGKTDGTVTLSAEDGNVKVKSDNPISDLTITFYVGNEEITEEYQATDKLEFTVAYDGKIVIADTEPTAEPVFLMGDGEVNMLDPIHIAKYVIGGYHVEIQGKRCADMDNDKEITLRDAVLVQRKIVGGWD